MPIDTATAVSKTAMITKNGDRCCRQGEAGQNALDSVHSPAPDHATEDTAM